MVTMFAEIDPLPGSKGKATTADRQGKFRAKQARFYVRRHIIASL
jgi:hypothetical protein